ncbi:MAG: DUF4193 family protein [Rhodococcus sp. (in: high G+C Gram-positive bacteria)]|nr:MAG: DUF4193 family protein [Rhodococcus sp. (in: high G+C Gram-positive bacteria)]
MATDYDAPRRTESDEVSEDSLEELKAQRRVRERRVREADGGRPHRPISLRPPAGGHG